MNDFDVIVIGSGPGGYTSACILAKAGLKTLVIEKEKIGGVCLNIGCIPTKAMIHIANSIENIKKNNDIFENEISNIKINRIKLTEKIKKIADNVSKGVEFLFKKNNVQTVMGEAVIIDKNTVKVNNTTYITKKLIIASGSRNKDISSFINCSLTNNNMLSSTEALFLEKNPSSIAILGGGAIGVEFAYIFNQMGSNVTILEFLPNLIPGMDNDCSRTIENSFKKNNIKVITNAKVTKIEEQDNILKTFYIKNDVEEHIESEYILNALGRTPNTDIEGLNNLRLDEVKGFIKVNENMETSTPCIYAIGDIVYNSPLLAHVAYDEARTACGHILKKPGAFKIDYSLVPFCIYTEPQVSGFGLSEKEAKEKNINFKTVKIFFKSSGKAAAIDKTDGFVKLIIDNQTEKIIGAHICGHEASELIHELLIAAKNGLKLSQICDTMHAHPTLSETIQEAARNFYGLSLH